MKNGSAGTRALVVAVFGMGCLVAPAAGQTMVGRVVAADTEAPLPGVFLTLTDSTGQRAAGILSRQDGAYVIRAPASGTYLLRLEMIGYRGLTETVRLEPGETLTRTLRMPLQAVELEAVVATASGRDCAVRPEGDALARLWDAARQALRLAEWSADAGWLRANGRTYQRVLDLADGEVLAETVRRMPSMEPNAFVADDPEVIRAEGFIRRMDDGSTLYRGADAALLLSDAFLDTHCFRLEERAEAGLVGLAFEPVPGRAVPEIEGVLWLEGETARLHSLEYQYVEYPISARLPRSRYGGLTEFRHLPDGSLGVQRWRIRMPVLLQGANVGRMRYVRRCGRDACDDGRTLRQLARLGLAIEEEGGAVLSYRFPDGTTLPAASRAAIIGTVLDSTATGEPTHLAGAEVFLVGTDQRAITDDRGRFRIDDLSEGTYRLAFQHPRLMELGIERPGAVLVEATPGSLASADLALPSRATLALGRCGALTEDGAPRPDARIIHGVVRDRGTGAPIQGATVRVRRPGAEEPGGTDGITDRMVAEEETDPAGRFLVCDAPDGPLEVTAGFLGKGEQTRRLEVSAGVPEEAGFELVLSSTGRLLGRVVRASDNAAVAGARVSIRDSGREVITNEDGRFVLDSIAPGALTVEAEHVAYRTSSGAVAMHGGEVVEVELRVAEQVFDLEPIVVTARSSPLLMRPRMGGFYIRQARGLGTFIGREELDERPTARVTDFLMATRGIRVAKSATSASIRGRRPASIQPNTTNPDCSAILYLDGARISNHVGDAEATQEAVRMLDQIPASELAGIEVYAGPASVPGEFGGLDTDCGVVAVWTRTRDQTRP